MTDNNTATSIFDPNDVTRTTISISRAERAEAKRIGITATDLFRIGLAVEVPKFDERQVVAQEAQESLSEEAFAALKARILAEAGR